MLQYAYVLGVALGFSFCKAGAFVVTRVTGLRELLPATAVRITAEAVSLAWGRGKTLLVQKIGVRRFLSSIAAGEQVQKALRDAGDTPMS